MCRCRKSIIDNTFPDLGLITLEARADVRLVVIFYGVFDCGFAVACGLCCFAVIARSHAVVQIFEVAVADS